MQSRFIGRFSVQDGRTIGRTGDYEPPAQKTEVSRFKGEHHVAERDAETGDLVIFSIGNSDGIRRQMAVLSNKPVIPSRAIVEALGLAEFFTHIYGGNSFSTKKPDPKGAQTILKETKALPQETLMVGNSSVDVITGRNAALWTCGVTYGFAPHTLCEAPPDVTVDKPQELAQLFA